MKASELNFLVVEDDDFQRRMLMHMLRSLGAASICDAGDGKRALDIIRGRNAPVDVVLCDLNMPEMDGLECLRHLGQELVSRLAVIIISALDNNVLVSVGKMTQLYGVNLLGILEKPNTLVQLEALIVQYERAKDTPQTPRTESRTFSLEEIRHGMREKQFEPFFQPKVDFKTGKISGAEALARWRHPEYGVIAPYAFIPQMEEANEIDELTFLMLEKVVSACRSLHDKGHLITISINLSRISLTDNRLAHRIAQVVGDAGVDPRYIMCEITESAVTTDVPLALENLARLCMYGFALSIDDYGTGYSSIQQLTRIAFSELKIDQAFVKDFATNPKLRIVVESSIEMARKLGVKGVAEGVETQAQWDTLKAMGCDVAQGYLIAKPMDLAACTEFCARYSPR